MKTRLIIGLALAGIVGTAGCDAEPEPDAPDSDPVALTAADVGTYQYFFLDAYRPLTLDDDNAPGIQIESQLTVYDADGSVPDHIDAFVMHPRPNSVIVTEAFPLEYSATETVAVGVGGPNARFRISVIGLDGWIARSDSRRETFDCVEVTPDGVHLRAETNDGPEEVELDWETIESHGETQLVVLPVHTLDGSNVAGEEGERALDFQLLTGC